MTLVEFLAPVCKSKNQDRILAVLYFKERYEGIEGMTIEQIRAGLKTARVPGAAKVNVADVLNKSGHLVDTPGLAGTKRLWRLTDSGRRHVRKLVGLPDTDAEIEYDVGTLTTVVSKVSDPDVRNYFEEALKCLGVGALRATVVFVWSGTVRTIQSNMLAHGSKKVDAALQKHDPKARQIHRIDDFAYVKDGIILLAAKELGIIDKSKKDTLKEALDLRNRCGHPGKYKPGVKKVSAFIEDVVSTVFS